MVHRETRPNAATPLAWALLLAVGLTAGRPALAGPISTAGASATIPALTSPTGNVETDFPAGQAGVITLVNPRYPTVNPDQYIAQNGLSTGWSIKDIRLSYDQASDRMYVGVNFFGIAGDADGNGDPGTVSAAAAAQGARDIPSLGGRESITVGFDFTNSGRPTILAGVPGDKSTAGSGLDGFTVASFKNTGLGLANSYGTPIANAGGLMFDPSAQHPDFEFYLNNFSKMPGYNPTNGYGLVAFAGTPDDIYEEEGVLFPRVSYGEIPEPASLLGWAATLGVAIAWRRRRGRLAR